LADWQGYAGLVYFHLLLDRLQVSENLSETERIRGENLPSCDKIV
jgi:hypothetical protein